MAGLVPAIHVFVHQQKNVDARDKPGHDGESNHVVFSHKSSPL
jgi:hypothetical protein